MKALVFASLIFTFGWANAQTADVPKARATSDLHAQEFPKTQSNNPDSALLYWSNTAGVNNYGTMTNIVIEKDQPSVGKVRITRPTGTYVGSSFAPPASVTCDADLGAVDTVSEPGKIIVTTPRYPVRVLCKDGSGSNKEFYVTKREAP